MMLSGTDLWIILGTSAGCTLLIMLLTAGLLRLAAARTIVVQWLILVAGAILAIVAATVAIAAEMYFSGHDLQVLLAVIGISAPLSLGAAIITGRLASSSLREMRASAQRIGAGDVVTARPAGYKELTELSEQLADTSAQLAEARAQLEQLDAARRQFFAWISHDLRTPLTGARMLCEALEEDLVDDRPQALRSIRFKVDTMSRLVDDLFELSRLQSGALRLHREHVALIDVVSEAAANVARQAEARDVRIEHRRLEDKLLWADPHELSRVMTNLLGNSVRHAPAGTAVVVSAERNSTGHLLVTVLDQGPGVDTEDLGHMFEVGWRAGNARTPGPDEQDAQAPGTGAGLGLAIVRGIVEAHGGTVAAARGATGFEMNISLPADSPR